MGTDEQFHIDAVLPAYWRVTFDNGRVNLLDPDTIEQLGAHRAYRRGSRPGGRRIPQRQARRAAPTMWTRSSPRRRRGRRR